MIDLDRRIQNAPAGLALTSALAISDSGAIVADSTAGLVLLLPGAIGTDAPFVRPLPPGGPVIVGTTVAFAASFSDRNSSDRHGAYKLSQAHAGRTSFSFMANTNSKASRDASLPEASRCSGFASPSSLSTAPPGTRC